MMSRYLNLTACRPLYNNKQAILPLHVSLCSMSKSFGQSFRIDRSKGLLAIKVFSSWDFKVSKKSSVRLQSENITTQLRVRHLLKIKIY